MDEDDLYDWHDDHDEECPTCGSPEPHLHPAVQCEGEVETCADDFHLRLTNQQRPEYLQAVRGKQAAKAAATAV